MALLRRRPRPEALASPPADEVRLYHASWCFYCLMVLPRFKKLLSREPQRLQLVDLSDYNDPRWDRDRIAVVPTLVALREGLEVARRRGPFTPGGLQKFIQRQLQLTVG